MRHPNEKTDILSDNSESEHRGRSTMLAKVLRRSLNSESRVRYLYALSDGLCGSALETWIYEAKKGSADAMALIMHTLRGEKDH